MQIRRLWLYVWKCARYIIGLGKAPLYWWLVSGSFPVKAIVIGRLPHVRNEGRMTLGRGLRVRSLTYRSSFSVGPEGNLVIGDDVSVNQGSILHAALSVTIGSRVSIGDCVRIYDTNFHAAEPNGPTKTSPVVIGDDCWLGAGSVILPGVTLGRGAVIGAGAVVAKDVPAGGLYVSQPGSVVRHFVVPDDFRRRG